MGRAPKRQPGETAHRIANLRKGVNEFGAPLSREEETKRQDLLERNRLAAKRCRSKRRNQQLDLEAEGRRLTESNEELQVIVAELRAEVEVLRQLVHGHQPQGCHSGGLPKETMEMLMRPLPELMRSPSKASASTMSSPLASGLDDLDVVSPPVLSATSIGMGKRGHQPSSSDVHSPMIDPSLLGDVFHNNDFSFIHAGAHGTPNGQNIDMASLLRTA